MMSCDKYREWEKYVGVTIKTDSSPYNWNEVWF